MKKQNKLYKKSSLFFFLLPDFKPKCFALNSLVELLYMEIFLYFWVLL